jgi:hypothetical protein
VRFSNTPTLDLRRTFRKPPPGKLRKASLLVLLRSDLQSMYGSEGAVGGRIGAPLLVAMGVCAGLELLAKYWSGKTAVVQGDVLEFLTTVVGLTKPDAETLLQFRNSLSHGYGLATRRKKDDRPFSFSVDTNTTTASAVMLPAGPDAYIVHLWALKELFLKAIRRCRRAIAADWKRSGNFQMCIRNLGEIGITK